MFEKKEIKTKKLKHWNEIERKEIETERKQTLKCVFGERNRNIKKKHWNIIEKKEIKNKK